MNATPIRIMTWLTSGVLLVPALVLWHGLNPVAAVAIVAAVVGLALAGLRKLPRLDRNLGILLLLATVVYDVGYLGVWQWGVCRREVPAGSSLLLRYKGPFPFGSAPMAAEGTLAKANARGRALEIGILEFMPGPGRHFYNPLEYERQIVPDVLQQHFSEWRDVRHEEFEFHLCGIDQDFYSHWHSQCFHAGSGHG